MSKSEASYTLIPSNSLGTQPGGTWRGWGQGIQHPDISSASTFPAPHMYQGKVGVQAAPRYLGYKLSAREGYGFPGRNAMQPAARSERDTWSTWHCPEAMRYCWESWRGEMDPKVSQRDRGLPCRAPGAAGPSGPPQWLHMNPSVVSPGWMETRQGAK